MNQPDPSELSDAPDLKLPGTADRVAARRPDLWAVFQKLGEQTNQSGPLTERERRLVHLAFAVGADSQGATHSHVRRALLEGVGSDDLEHVALLAITTLGWPHAMRALTWVWDVTDGWDGD